MVGCRRDAPRCQVSGRGWKVPGTRAGSRKNPGLATSWEAKMAAKTEAKLFREQKTAAKDAHKAKLSARTHRAPQKRHSFCLCRISVATAAFVVVRPGSKRCARRQTPKCQRRLLYACRGALVSEALCIASRGFSTIEVPDGRGMALAGAR